MSEWEKMVLYYGNVQNGQNENFGWENIFDDFESFPSEYTIQIADFMIEHRFLYTKASNLIENI